MDVKDFEIHRSEVIPDLVWFRTKKFSDLRGSLFTTFHKEVMEQYTDHILNCITLRVNVYVRSCVVMP